MDNNSAKDIQFGFGKTNVEKEEQKVKDNDNLPVEETGDNTPDSTVFENKEDNPIKKHVDEEETDVDEEYTDYRKVTICLIKSYSLYRKRNDKVLPKRKDYIGSCVKSSQVLASNKEEVEAYFPNLVGCSVNDPSFVMRV